MSIKTPEEYIKSVQDDRVVYCRGERVKDVTTHPLLKRCTQMVAQDYKLAQDPQHKKLVTAKNEDGDLVSFCFLPPKSKNDLLRRREIIQTLGRIFKGSPGGAKLTGIDGLNGLGVACQKIDKMKGTNYAERVESYRKYLQKIDAAVALAMTDVKGDRGFRPSKQEAHKDYYVHIVDENKDGIVVRGAKMHISFAPAANEMIVLPCRAMSQDDKDYAVSFALPMNTKGVTIIAQGPEKEEGDFFNHPLGAGSYQADAVVVFDDVFVPNDRVFLKREWEFSVLQTYMFANFHRVTADAYKYVLLELTVGAAALLAEYNGIERYSHVRDKLAWLVMYAEATDALGRAACENCVKEPDTDLVYPNPMLSNMAKLWFAEYAHEAVKHVQDIGGGIMATIPYSKDFVHPVTGPLLDKYLGGKAGVPTEHRMRVINMAKDLTDSYELVASIHAEGSLAAQQMSIHALADFERYKAAARRAAGI